jgi:hypothetical protein
MGKNFMAGPPWCGLLKFSVISTGGECNWILCIVHSPLFINSLYTFYPQANILYAGFMLTKKIFSSILVRR